MPRSYQKATFIVTTVAVTSILGSTSASAFSCGPGHYRGASRCEPCLEDTYISDLNHTSIDCIPCHLAESSMHEYEVEKCSRTADTQILCTPRYYRWDEPQEPALGECILCSKCGVGDFKDMKVSIKPCGNKTDTLCCESAEFEAQEMLDALGRMYLQCLHSSNSTTAPPSTNTTETVGKSSQKTRKGDNLPSAGRKLTSIDRSVVVVTFVWTFLYLLV